MKRTKIINDTNNDEDYIDQDNKKRFKRAKTPNTKANKKLLQTLKEWNTMPKVANPYHFIKARGCLQNRLNMICLRSYLIGWMVEHNELYLDSDSVLVSSQIFMLTRQQVCDMGYTIRRCLNHIYHMNMVIDPKFFEKFFRFRDRLVEYAQNNDTKMDLKDLQDLANEYKVTEEYATNLYKLIIRGDVYRLDKSKSRRRYKSKKKNTDD